MRDFQLPGDLRFQGASSSLHSGADGLGEDGADVRPAQLGDPLGQRRPADGLGELAGGGVLTEGFEGWTRHLIVVQVRVQRWCIGHCGSP